MKLLGYFPFFAMSSEFSSEMFVCAEEEKQVFAY